jgi:hypothetical protein
MYLEREETLFKTTLGGIMKGLERRSEQYTYDVKEVEPAKPVHADQYIEQPTISMQARFAHGRQARHPRGN